MRLTRRSVVAVAVIAALLTVSQPHAAHAYDVARVKQKIRAAWGGNDRKAIRVARCESGLNPKALSSTGRYRGLWQFSLATWNEYDPPADDPIKVSAFKQTQVAYRLYQDRGWAPWPSCGSSGKAADSGPGNTEVRRSH